MSKKRVTLSEVADVAGVSKQTVSRAINNKGEISEKTKARVMEAVHQLGYRVNRVAQAMNTQRTRMVGLLVSDITNAFFPEVARGAQDAALARDYTILIVNTDEDPVQEMRMLELMAEHSVAGIISFTHQITDEQLLAFADDYRPIIMINRDIEHPSITPLIVDNGLGAELAVNHLVEQGHQHIAMLTNVKFASGHVRRVQGYLRALARHQLRDYLYSTSATSTGGYSGTSALLQNFPEVTAIFCYNDMMAIGALRACLKSGKQVPEEIAIVGFDDIQLVSEITPTLSSIHVDKYEIGRRSFERIIELIDDAEKSPPINLQPSLKIRDSSRHLHQ